MMLNIVMMRLQKSCGGLDYGFQCNGADDANVCALMVVMMMTMMTK